MLGFYSVLGRRLHAYRRLLWCLAAFAILVFVGTIFWSEPTDDQTYALSSIVLLLWVLSLIVVSQAFSTPAPGFNPAAGLMDRIRVRVARGFRWIMAITTTGLFCFVILLSFKAAGLLLRG
jgi:hypothetical protein